MPVICDRNWSKLIEIRMATDINFHSRTVHGLSAEETFSNDMIGASFVVLENNIVYIFKILRQIQLFLRLRYS